MDRDPGPDIDTIFAALSDRSRRRLLLRLLDEESRAGRSITVESVIQTREEGEDDLIQFRHKHLPSLAAAGFIRWDRETNEVSEGDAFGRIRPLLRSVRTHIDTPSGTD